MPYGEAPWQKPHMKWNLVRVEEEPEAPSR